MTGSSRPEYSLGLDLGGSSVKAVVLTPSGQRLAFFNESFDPDRRLHFAETIRVLVDQVTKTQEGSPTHLGLAAPGLVAKDGASIAFMPGRLAGLEGLDWGEFLGHSRVSVLNDAQAALLGEVAYGAARGATNVILLTLGTGVGGAAMVDGHLLRGHQGKAGHFGHVSLNPEGTPDICGAPGSLEDAIGNHNIVARSAGRYVTTHDLVQAHEAGDPFATAVWMKSVKALSAALVSLGNVLDPEVVILGGGIARCGEALFRPLRALAAAHEWKAGGPGMRLVPAELGELAGAHGAAWNASQ
ncbi:MAG TPA: ROK family protein [Verrucomicrobiota bacterium]|nr:ROK family protein [Verrucomicrobiota bacterium]